MQKVNSKVIFLVLWIILLSTTLVVYPWLWNPAETGKYFYFALAIGLSFPVAVVSFFAGRSAFRISLTDVAVFCFMLWVLMHGAFGGMRFGMELWAFLLLVPLYVTIRISLLGGNIANIAERVRPLLLVMVSATAVEAIWGALQLYGVVKSYNGIFAITGSFFNPAPYSCFLACSAPLALYFLLRGRSKVEKMLGLACIIATAIILPAAMSRAAWIGAVAGCLFLIVKSKFSFLDVFAVQASGLRQSKIKDRKSKIILIVGVALSVVLLLLGAYLIKKESADGRMFIWRTSMALVRDKPLAGSGFGSFQALYGGAQANYFSSGTSTEAEQLAAGVPEYAFNEYLQLTVEHGTIGLLLFLFVIYSFFHRRGYSGVNDSIAYTVKGSLVAFLIFAFFSYPFSVLALAALFTILAAASASLSPPVEQFSRRWVGFAAIILCVGVTVYASYQILSRYTAYREWHLAQKDYHAGKWEQARVKYDSLYPKLDFQKDFLFEYALCLYETEQYEASNAALSKFLYFGSDPMVYCCMGDSYKKMGDNERAEQLYLSALRMVPSRHYPLYRLMKLYNDAGATEMAKTMAEVLLGKPVKVKSKAIEEMREEARKILDAEHYE